jgi:23S rRNA (cytosine1962-C5)-methyltransferase
MLGHSYSLIDSGRGQKLEQFGPFLISRPCSQAIWEPLLPSKRWQEADAVFTREGENKWIKKRSLPDAWNISIDDIHFKIAPTDFGHVGVFPEQRDQWGWIQKIIKSLQDNKKKPLNVLNLFAYSGGATLAAAKVGASVCHLDASKGIVSWARENAALNQLEKAPIRWIVDDVNKFLKREIRRQSFYDAIIFDPPSFGRGSKGEVFKIEEDLPDILKNSRSLLKDPPAFVLFSCHTPGFTPLVMHHLLAQMMQGLSGKIESGEMVLRGSHEVLPLPSGTFARWWHHGV